jgi:hypothetical protein
MWMNLIFDGDFEHFSAQVPVTPVKLLASHSTGKFIFHFAYQKTFTISLNIASLIIGTDSLNIF